MDKIFHFSNKPPFPLKDGGCVAISSILRSLLQLNDVEVYHFTLSTYKHPFSAEAYPTTWRDRMKFGHQKIQTKTNIFDAIYHLLRNKSYNVARFYDKKVAKTLTQLIDKEKFTIAVFESIYLLPYLSIFKKKGIKVIVRTHNLEHEVWNSMAETQGNFLKQKYFKHLAIQLKKYEEKELKKVDGIIAITETDALFFQQFEPDVMTTVIPTAVKTNFPPPNYAQNDFYFLGAMDWKPNIEGIHWFLKEVIPEGLKGTQFFIGGKGLKKHQYDHPAVQNQGEVENAVDFIHQHGICIIPMHAGSGLKIKLLENMAMGKPIVTTTEGARGVDVEHEKHVLIADDPIAFRSLMYRLHLDQKLRKKLGTNAKKYIEQHYSFEKLTRRIHAFIKDI
ncbi:hypothetical protein CW751_03575 [Brumimicrobium salinarum]|uniref:Glycosyltransferase subfamily 4-like N-terminal domain-containing protein n=1 Tax=Brumimicrobium salinarum TaxID=2058658 RepID=A0A2I0R4V7_9FLAO|nr:glycosyltransferase family 4 protein [Brumimicrobium salinarum]PKR81616.1 hypothetical protein CW751_03575 [Brumimicrobium salinarum]